MRIIIFRGRLRNGTWVYGDLRQYPSGNKAIRSDEWGHMMAVEMDTIGQYSGMSDVSNIPIYEGDLIKAVMPETDVFSRFEWPVAEVIFMDGAFGLDDGHGGITPLRSFAPDVMLQVVGNIHDNPISKEGWNDNAN